jgi:hypothetical protein
MQVEYRAVKITKLQSADGLWTLGRPHYVRRQRKTSVGSARSETSNMHGSTLCGSRESLGLPVEQDGRWDASGSLRTYAEDARAQAVGWLHST